MNKSDCAYVLRRCLGAGKEFGFVRDGEEFICRVPRASGDFAKAPTGPSKEKVQAATYESMNLKV
jgi:hypothetical protein